MVLARILIFVITFSVGLLVMQRSVWIVQNFGYLDWAEKLLGNGGTYTAWKIIGVLIIIVGFLYALGTFSLGPETSRGLLGPS